MVLPVEGQGWFLRKAAFADALRFVFPSWSRCAPADALWLEVRDVLECDACEVPEWDACDLLGCPFCEPLDRDECGAAVGWEACDAPE